jgi:hypothetical protein
MKNRLQHCSHRCNRLKGQTAVFEEVMLFGIGVAIFIASFYIFSYYQETMVQATAEDHLSETMEYLSSTLLDVSRMPGNASVTLQIPEKINGRYYYTIRLNQTGLFLKLVPDGKEISSNLYGIQNGAGIIIRDSSIASVSRKIMIYKRGSEVGINTINI